MPNNYFKNSRFKNSRLSTRFFSFMLFVVAALTASSTLLAQPFVHPGISHKKSDLERMKLMVAAGKEPWKSSFINLSQNKYASYNYVVQGSSAMTVLDASNNGEYNKFKFDGLAAYYNSVMWYISGDERYAKKAVEIFNAWVNIKSIVSGGTKALDAGRVIWKMLEGAEIIKSTYSDWQQNDIDKFKAMLVYPGYSPSVEPTAAINSSNATFYWYMYNGDAGRHGNQGIFAMRGIMAMGIFMDNRVMYERALRYLTAQPRRTDDLPYVSGPPIVSATKASTSNEYYDEYSPVAPYQQTTIPDYGYDDQIQYYIYENGQGEESSRDQAHATVGVSILNTIAEMAWNQGYDMYSYLDNRILSGMEYALRYNVSYNYSFPDQTSPWAPTVESGEYIKSTDRSGRWTSLKINPWNGADLTRLTRGTSFKSDASPFHELILAHYKDRIGVSADKYKWTQRAYNISLNEFGYEGQGFEVDHPGFGGLTFRRANLSPGDPVQSFIDGQPVYGMNALPATIEAENYDYFTTGGQGKTYFDTDNSNTGGAYRPAEGVDVAAASEGGYAVTNMQQGEWLNYTVAVPKSGFYKITIRYSAINANGKIRFDFDGVNATGEVAVPFGESNSTGANDWKDFVVGTVALQPGVQSMRIYVAGSEAAFNLNSISIVAVDPSQPPAAPTAVEAKAGVGQVSLSWMASIGATSYKIKRATTSGGPYTTVASVDTSAYTNTGVINGTSYYYVISAINALGESANSTEANATPSEAVNLVEDNFETGLGSLVTGRMPEVSTIGNRVFQTAFTGAPGGNAVASNAAQLTTAMGEVIDISSSDTYTKPKYLNISGTFNEATLINNIPARPARGVYFGFWSSLSNTTNGFQNMRGVFVNPEDGELQLWNGSGSTTAIPVQSLPYQGTWDASAQHSISYTINTTTGNISDFVLDGVTYLWNKTNIFIDVNTNYAGFGVAGSGSGQYGYISNFKLKDNKVWNEVARQSQTINFPDFSDKKIGDADFNTTASATSGLPLTYVSSNTAIATVAADGTVHITGVGRDTITAYQAGSTSYETATAVSRVLTVTNNGSAASRLLIQDNFTAGDSVTKRTPDVATIFGRVYQKAKPLSTDKNLIVNGVAQLGSNVGEAIKITDTISYTRPTYINVADTFDLGTLTNNSPVRPARGVYLGFWKAIPTSTSTSIDSYSQFYGVFVNPDGTLRLWNGKNKSDSTPVQTLAYIGTWSGGATKHTMSYTINTTTGLMSNFVLDGVTTYAWKDTAVFTASNTNYAGFGVSGAASANYGNIHGFKVTNVSPLLSQTITFPAIPVKQTNDDDFNPRASASSGNPITYSSSNTTVATIVDGLVHIVGEGTTTITATQLGNNDYSSASATQTLTVKRGQTITFAALTDMYVGDADFNLTATASSGLPVTYSSSATGVAVIVNGTKVHVVGAGIATITASQQGDATYAAGVSAPQLLTVKKVDQTIAFDAIADRKLGDDDFDAGATATSGLPVVYASADESVATIVNNKIHVVGEGSVLITASQAGDSKFATALSKAQPLNITKGEQLITFNSIEDKTYGDNPFELNATASSGLPVEYAVKSGNAVISGNTLTITGAGAVVINATQAGNSSYRPAHDVAVTFNVNPKTITVSPAANQGKVYGDADPSAINYTSDALVGNDAFTGTLQRASGEDAGTYVVGQGTLSLNSNYNLIFTPNVNFTIAPKAITITADRASKTYGDTDPQLTYQITSGGLVNGDAFNGSLTRDEGENVGQYLINQGSLTPGSNYQLTYNANSLTINPKNLSIKANNQTKECGSAFDLGVTSFTVNGLAYHDAVTSVDLTSAGATADAKSSTYEIAASNAVGSGLSNYNISYTTGTLTVVDHSKPVPVVSSLPALTGECSVTVTNKPTAIDACAGTIVGTTTDPLSYSAQGAYTIMWSYDDGSNNITTQTQQVIVKDVTAPNITSLPTVGVFCYNANGNYSIPELKATDNCNNVTVNYTISGATVRSGSGSNASGIYNVGSSTINWTADDGHGNKATATTTVTVNPQLTATIPDVYATSSTTDSKNTLYIGYGPSSLTISANANGGTSPCTYVWSTGQKTQSISVSTAGTFSVTIIDAKGCTASANIVINTINVECGNSNDKVTVCHNGTTICVASNSVQEHLNHGDNLGICAAATSAISTPATTLSDNLVANADFSIYPNPSSGQFKVRLSKLSAGKAVVIVRDEQGRQVLTKSAEISPVGQTIELNISSQPAGIYYVQVISNGEIQSAKVIVQH
jgi:hypothetical protein